MKLKSTPGPWWLVATDDRHLSVHGTMETGAIFAGIARCPIDDGSDEELNANANLIVAAPDLYEALEEAMPFIDDALDVVEFMSESVLTEKCREAVRLARTALKKARGE